MVKPSLKNHNKSGNHGLGYELLSMRAQNTSSHLDSELPGTNLADLKPYPPASVSSLFEGIGTPSFGERIPK